MDRVALVTGANSGIGLAIAERFLADGYGLGYATRTRKDEHVYRQLAEAGPIEWVVGDLADVDVPARLVEQTVAAFGRLDVLVNNAGTTLSKPALELTADDFDSVFAVAVRGAFLCAQAAARAMGEQGGVIVNITSVHEHVPRPGFAVYAPAKAALGMITRSLALELAPAIRVVSVAPGAIAVERNEPDAKALRPEIPLGRAGTPEEVAACVAWLASDEARYVTGTSYLVDGGMAQQVVP
ncbi:MAG TPA: SDR family oxidoreductase [Actinomycetes bacterium]|nr:SDR family oxidoreductase [Actinomycetes bacterium]